MPSRSSRGAPRRGPFIVLALACLSLCLDATSFPYEDGGETTSASSAGAPADPPSLPLGGLLSTLLGGGGPPAAPPPLSDHSALCAEWAAAGECSSNPRYMLRSCSLSCSRYDLPPPPPVLEQLLEVGRTALRGGPVRDPDPEAHRARLERVRQARMSTQNQQPSRHASHLAQQQQQHSSEDCEEPGGHDTRVDAGGRGSSSSEQPAHVSVPDVVRQRRVREAFQHAWGGYTKHAWGTDELEPSQQRGVTSFGMGLTLVDSLDTLLLIMGNDSVEVSARAMTSGGCSPPEASSPPDSSLLRKLQAPPEASSSPCPLSGAPLSADMPPP